MSSDISLLDPGHKAAGLTASNVACWFGTKKVLEGVNLDMAPGQVTALIGPSGCGKSTFLRTLNRMHELVPSATLAGEILIDGVDIYRGAIPVTDVRRRIGMVFQKPNPFPKSIFDNVAFGPRLHRIYSRTDLEELVEQSLRASALWDEVKDRLTSSALGLSGGQQQRLCIARSVAVKPSVLLLDEPTSALDPISTGKVEELVNELKSDYTIAIVTHNMQQAARCSDYTAYMYLGDLMEFGSTEQMFFKPTRKETEDYITGRFG